MTERTAVTLHGVSYRESEIMASLKNATERLSNAIEMSHYFWGRCGRGFEDDKPLENTLGNARYWSGVVDSWQLLRDSLV